MTTMRNTNLRATQLETAHELVMQISTLSLHSCLAVLGSTAPLVLLGQG